MDTVIRKWGNSPAVRIPMSVMSAARLDLEQKVSVTVEDGRIIIEPTQNVEYSLDSFLDVIPAKSESREYSTFCVGSMMMRPSSTVTLTFCSRSSRAVRITDTGMRTAGLLVR